jgi:tetratricopeptide (TPR) repeat protein
MLRAHYGNDALPERVGHHLLAAGDHEAALDPLSVAAKRRFDRGDYDRALAIVLEREQALSAMMIGLQDKRWIEGWLLTVRAGLARNDYDAAEQVLQRAEQHAVDNYQVAEICLLHAEMCWHRAQMTEALELAESTQRQFRALGDRLGEADCRAIAAKCHLEGTGDFARALVEARAARKSYEDLSDRDRIAAAEYLESKILVEIGDLDGAERQCLAAELYHSAEGHRMGLAKCANQLGEIARLRRRLAEAESLYMKSLTLLEAMSSESATAVRVNLALVLVQRSLFGRALPMLRQLQSELTQAGMERAYGHIDYALLACLAAEKHWDAFDDQLALCGQWVPARGRVDKDYAALAEQAAGFASQVSDNERAGAALSLAIVHLDAIGKSEHANSLREQLVRLGTRRSDRAP